MARSGRRGRPEVAGGEQQAPGPVRYEPRSGLPDSSPQPVATATQRAFTSPAVETPKIQPCQGPWSQCEPNPAYTTPFMSKRPGRCIWVVGWKVIPGWFWAAPPSWTGNPAFSVPFAKSIASRYQRASPELPEA